MGARFAAGLTLIEFLFAVSIMAIAALGVASMFPVAYKSVVEGGQVTKATMLAEEMMSMIKGYPYDQLPTSLGNFDSRTDSTVAGATCPPNPTAFVNGTQATLYVNVKWFCDLRATTGLTTGQGLPNAYGTVKVACVDASWNEIAPWCDTTNPNYQPLLRVTVEVHWGLSGAQMVRLVGYVSRPRT